MAYTTLNKMVTVFINNNNVDYRVRNLLRRWPQHVMPRSENRC